MFRTINRFALLPIMLAASVGAAAAASSPIGVWIDHTGRGAVEITDCGGKLCGHIVWVKDAGHSDGCNFQVIGNVKPMGGKKWDGGWIIDPDKDPKTKYDVEITPLSDHKLKVLGYMGTKFFSETMTWTRAPADLKRCGQANAAKPEAPKRDEQRPDQQGEPRSDIPPAAPPVAKTNPPRELVANRPQVKERHARAKQKECTFNIPQLGKVTIPC